MFNVKKLLHHSNFRAKSLNLVARGAGFEPARPVRTTGLAGLGSACTAVLPPTRLGQPRFSMRLGLFCHIVICVFRGAVARKECENKRLTTPLRFAYSKNGQQSIFLGKKIYNVACYFKYSSIEFRAL